VNILIRSLRQLFFNAKDALHNESGQTLAEYGLILVLIAVVVFLALQLTGTTVSGMYSNVAAQFP